VSKILFLFPGQGSQSIGMLAGFATETVVQDTFAEASDILGFDLWALSQTGTTAELGRTEITQPAILTASTALWYLFKNRFGPVELLAGHSLGEYSALVAAGSLAFADAVELVHQRGKLMQAAVPAGSGAMAAIIGLDDDRVIAACSAASEGDVVAAVNFNSPGQVVIAGTSKAVERAIGACKSAGAKRALPLPVSVPSHCALMSVAAELLAAKLDQCPIGKPHIAVINNVDVACADTPAAIRDALRRQLFNPVRWAETIRRASAEGATTAFECGPGKVLSGLCRRIERSLTCQALDEPTLLS